MAGSIDRAWLDFLRGEDKMGSWLRWGVCLSRRQGRGRLQPRERIGEVVEAVRGPLCRRERWDTWLKSRGRAW